MDIFYQITITNIASHLFDISVLFSGLKEDKLTVHLPSWRPGRYLILDFAGDLFSFKAEDKNGSKLSWEKLNKNTWRIDSKGIKDVKISYTMYADEFNLRTKGLNESHAFINPVTMCMYSEKYRNNKLRLELIHPAEWHISSGLSNIKDSKNIFEADNYDVLADSPLEIGTHIRYEFSYDEKIYQIALWGYDKMNMERFRDDFIKMIDVNKAFWGKYPYDRYLIIIHCSESSGGGTEHINSTVVGCKPIAFEDENAYLDFLRLISHEFFHTWNVKQMKPAALTPYNYLEESYTEELWVAEGGTSYYDGMLLLRTGHYNKKEIFEEIEKYINDERKRPGNKIQSLAESSFDAWIKFWKPKQNKYNVESDYYAKGSYVSFLLDLEIRNMSSNRYSLDNVYRYIYENYPKDKKGYINNDFITIINKFTNKDIKPFFDEYIYDTVPLDWENKLKYAGIEVLSEELYDEKVFKIKQTDNPSDIQMTIFEDCFKVKWSDTNGV